MSKIQETLALKNGKALSIFFTAGYPQKDDTTEILEQLQESGVDFVEVGLPFSDPLADGPTIQHSSSVALQNGMQLDVVFAQLKSIKDVISMPMVLMGYWNQVAKYGVEAFCQNCKEIGVDTLIIPDLPMIEYDRTYEAVFSKHGISNVFLISPSTSEARIREIDAKTKAFIYVVASSSITGAKGEVSPAQIDYFTRIKNMGLKSKLMIGFGISDAATFQTATKYADGAIIGSAFIKHIGSHGIGGIEKFISMVREG